LTLVKTWVTCHGSTVNDVGVVGNGVRPSIVVVYIFPVDVTQKTPISPTKSETTLTFVQDVLPAEELGAVPPLRVINAVVAVVML